MRIVRNQPQRTRDDLLAKLMLVTLLKTQLAQESPLAETLRMVVQQFASPFIDHPDMPRTPEHQYIWSGDKESGLRWVTSETRERVP